MFTAALIRLGSKGPAIYWSDRIGKSNTVFNMNKTERHAIELFGETVKSRLGEYSEQEYDMNAQMASPFSLAVHEEGLLLP